MSEYIFLSETDSLISLFSDFPIIKSWSLKSQICSIKSLLHIINNYSSLSFKYGNGLSFQPSCYSITVHLILTKNQVILYPDIMKQLCKHIWKLLKYKITSCHLFILDCYLFITTPNPWRVDDDEYDNYIMKNYIF